MKKENKYGPEIINGNGLNDHAMKDLMTVSR